MDNHSDWRYRYNAMGEREQKRLYHAPLADSIAGQPYPWVYYVLGGSKDQLAVWHGQQITSPFCDTVRGRNVFLYPTEYLTNGIGWNGVHEDITPIITKPDGSKEYRISDHLASLRVSLTNGSALNGYDYDPWGNLLGGATAPRRGFNDNEKDKENGVFNLGVRKYEEGRFLSLDPLFEKEPEISPYVYAGNAPLNYVDPEGLQRKETNNPKGYSGMQTAVDKPGATFPNPSLSTEQWSKITTAAEMVGFAMGMNTGQVLDLWLNGSVEASAAEALPDLTGKTSEEAQKILEGAGFQDKGTTDGGYKKWYHPDGSRVQIRPDGEIVRTGPKVEPAGGGLKYRPRIGPDGKKMPEDAPHNTGETINQ